MVCFLQAPNSLKHYFFFFIYFGLPFGKQLVCQFCFLISKEKKSKGNGLRIDCQSTWTVKSQHKYLAMNERQQNSLGELKKKKKNDPLGDLWNQ